MEDVTGSPDLTRRGHPAWILGGGLMLGAVGVDLVSSQIAGTVVYPWIGIFSSLVWAASLAVFAFGLRGADSVVARRPLGVAALLVAGLAPLAFRLFWSLLAGPVLDAGGRAASMVIGYAQLLVPAVALLIAVVAIARAGVVPAGIRWVPAIVLAGNVAAHILAEGAGLFAPALGQQVLVPLFALVGLVRTAGSLLLGILAVVYGARREPPASVQIYPPAS